MRVIHIGACFAVAAISIGTLGQKSPAISSQSLLQALLQSAEESHTPLGIVLGSTDGLCQKMTTTTPSYVEAYKDMLSVNGYTFLDTEGTFIIRPVNPSPTVRRAMRATLNFPQITGRMRFIGMVLQGWISSVLDGAKGFGIDFASSGQDRDLTLVPKGESSVQEIANSIVNLDDAKGVWILSSTENPGPAHETRTRLEVYSYKDDTVSLASAPCMISDDQVK